MKLNQKSGWLLLGCLGLFLGLLVLWSQGTNDNDVDEESPQRQVLDGDSVEELSAPDAEETLVRPASRMAEAGAPAAPLTPSVTNRASVASLARTCGVSGDPSEGSVATALEFMQRSSEHTGKEPPDEQLEALNTLEALCRDWEDQLFSDARLREQAESEIAALSQTLGELYDVARRNPYGEQNRLSEEQRALAIEIVEENAFTESTMAAVRYLINYDDATMTELGNLIRTEDLAYLRRLNGRVQTLVGCRLAGGCGPDSFSGINSCMSNPVYCNGIVEGVQSQLSIGQFEETLLLTDAILGYIYRGNWPSLDDDFDP